MSGFKKKTRQLQRICNKSAANFAKHSRKSREWNSRQQQLNKKRKMFFRLVTSVGQRKHFWVPTRNRTSDLRIPCSDAVTTEPQTPRWAKVPSWGLKIFSCPTLETRRKNIFLYFFTELKTYHLSYFYRLNKCEQFQFLPGWKKKLDNS